MLGSQKKMTILFRAAALAVLLPIAGVSVRASWVATGPYGGSAQIVAIDPEDSSTLLAGTRSGLLYRSGNAGDSWAPAPFPHLYGSSIYSIAMDPKHRGVYWIGVAAEAKRKDDTVAGVYTTGDGGQTWSQVEDMKGKSVFALAVWPGDSAVMAAGTDEGVWRSVDGGKTWARASAGDNPEMQGIVSLAFDPSNRNVLYAGTPHLPWKTTDGGRSWYAVHEGMIDDSDVFSIRVDSSQPRRIFASACSGIYCSRDGGGRWTKLQGIPKTDRRTHAIAQDPQHPETIYAGTTVGLWKSTDAGLTWVKKSDRSINGMAVDPSDGGILYLATDSTGLIKSKDGGETFHACNEGFVNRNITQFVAAGVEYPLLFASTAYDGASGGIFRSENMGDAWALVAPHERLLNENVISFAVSPRDTRSIWAASFDGLLKSADGGMTWVRPKTFLEPERPKAAAWRAPARGRGAVRPVARRPIPMAFPAAGVRIHSVRFMPDGATEEGRPTEPALLAGTSAGLFISRDGGIYWMPVGLGNGTPLAVLSIFLPVRDTGAMAVLTPAGLYVSLDRGGVWKKSEMPDHANVVYDVAMHPSNPSEALAATSAGVMLSRDGGLSWNHCVKGLPWKGWFNSAVYDPARPGRAYVTEVGRIYETSDGGSTWSHFDSKGLEEVWIRALIPGGTALGSLMAVSQSRGVYIRAAAKPGGTEAGSDAGTTN